ncbi:MAG: hypothetical protein AAF485_01995 [Chloroflexota bacterium]
MAKSKTYRRKKSLPFTGEMMTCVVCEREEKSDPLVESQWRALQVDNVLYYACPSEFPPDEVATSDDFKMAYRFIITLITAKRSDIELPAKMKALFETVKHEWKEASNGDLEPEDTPGA